MGRSLDTRMFAPLNSMAECVRAVYEGLWARMEDELATYAEPAIETHKLDA